MAAKRGFLTANPASARALVEMAKAGWTYKRMAAALGVHHTTVAGAIKRLRIPHIASPGPRPGPNWQPRNKGVRPYRTPLGGSTANPDLGIAPDVQRWPCGQVKRKVDANCIATI